jgi:hypothetical protein
MSVHYRIVLREPYWSINISSAEQAYGATYMGDFATMSPAGSWIETPVCVFYQPNPDVTKGHKNYFGVFIRDKMAYITDATSAFCEKLYGRVADDGQVVISGYRHDYVTSEDGSVFIDGGRDYTRSNGVSIPVTVENGEFSINLDGVDIVLPKVAARDSKMVGRI